MDATRYATMAQAKAYWTNALRHNLREDARQAARDSVQWFQHDDGKVILVLGHNGEWSFSFHVWTASRLVYARGCNEEV